MKIRSGFVTNSSSSSYICVFAQIADPIKVKEIVKKYDLEMFVETGTKIIEEMSGKYFYGYGADWAGCDITPPKNSIDPEQWYIYWHSSGGAGDNDSDFAVYGSNGEYYDTDYDVDLDDFRDNEQEIYNAINEDNGFAHINKGYGAGRDG